MKLKRKDPEKFSPGLEAFLDFLRYAAAQHEIAKTAQMEADAVTQDILHTLELQDPDRAYMERLARKLKRTRRERRLAKDTAARTSCIADWVGKNAAVIKSLERLLGEVRREEKKAAGRIYIPRTQALEDIKPRGNQMVSFGRFQDTEYAVQEGGLVQAAATEEKKGGD